MTSSKGRETSSPRVYGTTQKLQYLLQPSMIDTNAAAPSARAGGRWSNFSISGNEMSTCARPVARLRGIGGLLEAFGGGEHVGHLVRVVLVHLAPESADEDLLGRGHAILGAEVNPGRRN